MKTIDEEIENKYKEELNEYENVYKIKLTDTNKEQIKRRIEIEIKLWKGVNYE